jgi:protein-S-isoprenylcysteine O-methyltransferase Ste14
VNFHIVFAVQFIFLIGIRLYFHRLARRNRSEVAHHESRINMALRALVGFGYIGALSNYIFYPNLLNFGEFPLSPLVHWIGGGISTLSLVLLWWVHRSLGIQFDTTLHTQMDHQLIRHGPYRWVRHPMYTALFSMGLGWLLLTANWSIGVPLMVSISIVSALRVRHEERVMLNLFPEDYAVYMQNTGRYLPRMPRP